jgi:hypothetical protein
MRAMSATPLPPNLQAALERLFEMFSAYVAARNVRERTQIHAQILDLFSRLGVVSDSALVRQAAEMFEIIQQERVVPKSREATLANEARDFVASRIRAFERTPNAPSLSAGARQLLRTPVVEVAELALQFEPEQVSHSLDSLFASLREPPVSGAEGTAEVRTSIVVIRAFWKNFCRIPPFCSGGGQK